MYFRNRLCTSAPLKEKIIHEYKYNCWSVPTFNSIEEDDTMVELFVQEQETPIVYNGEKVDLKIDFDEPSEFQVQMLTNYVKNVGGEIKDIKIKRSRGGWFKTVQIAVPKDAPYCKDLKGTIYSFIHSGDKTIAKYKLRHEEHKQLPDHRKEAKYIKNHMDERCEISIKATIAIMLVALFLELLFL